MRTPRLLLLNGSLRGADGNTGWLLREAGRRAGDRAHVVHVDLADAPPSVDDMATLLRGSDALLVGTGVYWHSWGSPLQRFLEAMTPFENTDCFFGKPAGVVVTMDSVGGIEMSSRLQGTLNLLGCGIPPCTSLVLSRLAAAEADDDVWGLDDLDTVVHNLLASVLGGPLTPWPVRHLVAPSGPWPATGRLDLGSPRFLPRRMVG